MIRRFHSVPGLALGLALSLTALSGAVLSVQPAIERAAAPPTPALSIGEVAQRVTAAHPGTQSLTLGANGTLTAQIRDAAGPRALTLDPATGATLPDTAEGPVMRWVKAFHRSFLMGDAGRAVVGLMAAAMALLIGSGLWLMARALGGWRKVGAPVRAGGAKGWHARIGRVALAGLAVSALSGAFLSAATFGLVADGTPPALPRALAREAAPMAYAAMPALDQPLSALRRLSLPARPGEMLRLETGAGVAQVDPGAGTVAGFAPATLGARVWEWAYQLHTGHGLWALGLMLGTMALAVPVLAATGAGVWLSRRAGRRIPGNVPMASADLVILTGTEGGSTRGFAHSLHAALTKAGARVHVGDMNDIGVMPQARALILLAATYGDGTAPASAARFLDRLHASTPLPVAVLGFGDRAFPAFCGYAETVAAALAARGWPALLPLARIDRQSPAEFAAWGRDLGAALSLAITPEHRPALPRRHRLRLVSRRDYGAAVQAPTVILRFAVRPRWLGGPRFQAGDLLGVLAPDAAAPRFYSLASSAEDGFVEICVRKVPGGVCSGYLHGLRPGDEISGFTRANAAFRAEKAPLVMISAGCGIGPMAGLLRRAAPGVERTLYFGLRDPASDFLYAEELGHWQSDGRLTRLRTAVSRARLPVAPPPALPARLPVTAADHRPGHVQHRLREDTARLRDQIARGARVLVCGSVAMGRAAAVELDAALAPLGLSVAALKQEGRYVEDVY